MGETYSILRHFRSGLAAGLILGCGLAVSVSVSAADEGVEAVGKNRFMSYCAVCHGADAKGAGVFTNVLKKAPSDLTMLAKANAGEFPFNAVYDVIDGRDMPVVHGSNEMPIWGGEWKAKGTIGGETALRGRILEIIIYLRSIQQ